MEAPWRDHAREGHPGGGRLAEIRDIGRHTAPKWLFFDTAFATIFYFGGAVAFMGSVINGTSYPAVSQMVPNEMRGQAVTAYMLLGYTAGMGIAPTAVALITDRVFQDPMMVRQSVILVALPAHVLGAVFTVLALKPYRMACEASLTLTGSGPGALGAERP